MSSRKHQPILIPFYGTSSPSDSYSSDSSSSSSMSDNAPSSFYTKSFSMPTQMYSASTTRQRQLTPPQTLLGAIDENSGAILPDTSFSPDNKDNPVAKLHVYTAILSKKPTLASPGDQPSNDYNMLIGPNGEKFTDLRMNRKIPNSKKPGLKRFMCFG